MNDFIGSISWSKYLVKYGKQLFTPDFLNHILNQWPKHFMSIKDIVNKFSFYINFPLRWWRCWVFLMSSLKYFTYQKRSYFMHSAQGMYICDSVTGQKWGGVKIPIYRLYSKLGMIVQMVSIISEVREIWEWLRSHVEAKLMLHRYKTAIVY